MKHKRNTGLFLVLAGIIILCGISSAITYAYLSDATQSMRNTVTAGTIQIELLETNWTPSANSKVLPGTVIQKNPAVVNTGKNAAHVFLEIRIPMKKLAVIGTDQKKTESIVRELFTFQANGLHWEEVKRYQDGQQMVYIYGYDKLLYPQEETSELFESVEIVNYLEGELEAEEMLAIDVQAKAIQTGINTVGEEPEEIYNILIGQIELDR